MDEQNPALGLTLEDGDDGAPFVLVSLFHASIMESGDDLVPCLRLDSSRVTQLIDQLQKMRQEM